MFQPDVLPPTHRFDRLGADVQELTIPLDDGATLSALHLRLPKPRGLVFYLHGNAGSLQSWFVNADFYRRAGYDLFMLDYRGYGKSTGRIESEAQLRADVRAAWDRIAPRWSAIAPASSIAGPADGETVSIANAARCKSASTIRNQNCETGAQGRARSVPQ